MAATLKVDTITNASNAGTANLTLDASGNATVGNTLVMGSSFKRNRIINGNMQIWQRGTTLTTTSGANNYLADRFATFSGGTSATWSQSTSVPSTAGSAFQYSFKMQRTSGNTSTNSLYLSQIIESVNCYDLSSQQVTLSFWAKAGANYSASGSVMAVYVTTGTAADQGLSSYNGGTWTGQTNIISTTTQPVTTTWTRYTFTGTMGAGVLETGVQFAWTPTGTAGADDALYITGVQLEVGSIATPYERQIYSDQLAQCQRYCQKWGGLTSYEMISGSAIATSATQAYPFIQYIVPMRAIPTLTYSTVRLQNVNAGFAITSLTIGGNTGVNALLLTATVASGLTSTAVYYMDTNNSTSAYVILSSEL